MHIYNYKKISLLIQFIHINRERKAQEFTAVMYVNTFLPLPMYIEPITSLYILSINAPLPSLKTPCGQNPRLYSSLHRPEIFFPTPTSPNSQSLTANNHSFVVQQESATSFQECWNYFIFFTDTIISYTYLIKKKKKENKRFVFSFPSLFQYIYLIIYIFPWFYYYYYFSIQLKIFC